LFVLSSFLKKFFFSLPGKKTDSGKKALVEQLKIFGLESLRPVPPGFKQKLCKGFFESDFSLYF
jgi:hypothetical protein